MVPVRLRAMSSIPLLAQLMSGTILTEADAEALFEDLLSGRLDAAQIGALLGAMQARGVHIDELVGVARVMRRHVVPVPVPKDAVVIDTCGTGGAPKTFNVSTAAAIVAAAAGSKLSPRVVVAKHGNRSRTGRGSAEVLRELGVNIDAPPDLQSACLDACGVCFCFAIHHHPAMKHAAGPRRSLGTPTIFNLLGPLTNPAAARHQLLGVSASAHVDLVAAALAKLGCERAMVAHGHDGLDELTTCAATEIAVVDGSGIRRDRVEPGSLGLKLASHTELTAVDAVDSARIIREVFDGRRGPPRDIVVLNAAAALMVGGAAEVLGDGVRLAAEAIDSGGAQRTLARLAELSTNTG